jgi:hypothetical protein
MKIIETIIKIIIKIIVKIKEVSMGFYDLEKSGDSIK